MEGWVKLYRQTLENPIVCKDAEYFSVWCYLLLNATHKSYKVEFKGEVISLAPGQLITGRKKIAQQFNISESKVQRILKKLEIEQQIEQQTSTKKRLISVLNWDKYQSIEQQDEQQVNNKRTTSEQQVNTNKNVRTEECKEGKKKPLSDVPSDLVKDVIAYLNEKTGKAFKPASKKTQSLIKARVKDLSVGLDDFKKVIDVKCSQWLDDPNMSKYLQPTTLFGTKFEGYLNEWVEPKKPERDYKIFGDDPADLEGIDIDNVPF
jgi:uncharacterized phage protein (TIGR02220 family)